MIDMVGAKMKFAKRMIELRKKKGMTQEDMANLLGVTRQTISNYENEKSYPDITLLFKISKEFDISLDELLTCDEKMVSTIKKNEKQKKVFKILSIILVIILLIIVICLVINHNKKSESFEVAVNYNKIEAVEKSECDKNKKLYHNDGFRNIYLYCLDEISIVIDEKNLALKDYLSENMLTIDWFINLFNENEIYDSKNKVYSGLKNSGWYSLSYKLSKDEVKIIECNSTDNNNVYIGSKDMYFDKSFCE